MSFAKELMRRNVVRVILTYAVAGWLLVEGMDLLTDTFEAPAWVMKVFVGTVLLGILPVAIFSWVYEITPEGIKKESADMQRRAPGTGRKLDIALLLMLAIAIGLFVEQRINSGERVATTSATEPVAERSGPPMLAVLPFVSASLEGESAFFAVGVHDDLLTQLAQIHSLRVISRTSVLEYRDTVLNIRDIGKALGADAILEGGVQSAGNRIRINAQLIDAKTDEHLWAQTFDRELSPANIFDVQTEIARAITTALRSTLTEQDAAQLSVIPTENMAAYRAYHRAMEIRDDSLSAFDQPAYREALEEAVALDPTFTRAWAELVGTLSYQVFFNDTDPEVTRRAEEALEIIRSIAPNSADHLVGQAYYAYYVLRAYDKALQLVVRAGDMRPSDVRIMELKSWIERRQGNFDGRIETIRKIVKLDPRNSNYAALLINDFMLTHRYDEAKELLDESDFQGREFSYWKILFQFREHEDLGRWAADLKSHQEEFAADSTPYYLWELHIARRDYAGAEELLPELRESPVLGDDVQPYLSSREAGTIITYWMQGPSDRLSESLIEARLHLDEHRNSDGEFVFNDINSDMALVAAAEGNREEVERLLRQRWRPGIEDDLAERLLDLRYSCQVLGMVGAAAAAVDCIRSALEEPSAVIQFVEPYLPYYDAIREEPEFVKMMAEFAE